MTTTPTASPELLDLDKLEALADAMPEHLRLKGWYVDAPSFGQQHVYADNFKGQGRQHIASLPANKTYFAGLAEFIAAFDPATVKHLIALARRAKPEGISIALREVTDKLAATAAENLSLGMENRQLRDQIAERAQPEGEAPQADLEQLNGGMHDSIFVKVWGDAGGGDAGRRKLADYAYALGKRASISLSPLCGAQHAESGKEVAIAGLMRYSMWSNSTAHGMDSSLDGQWVSYADLKEALATQQAAAARDVLAERQRQVEQEGWAAERDDKYTNCELARAAATYATCSHIEQLKIVGEIAWPWHPDWFKRSTYRRDLVKAGALVLAEIERLDRAAQLDGGQEGSTT